MKIKIKVLSQYLFDEKMVSLGLDDTNVEYVNMAFISIIGSKECLDYYLYENDTKHYFSDHRNVLNLEFDDTDANINYGGHLIRTMNMNQAEQSIDFIENTIKDGITYYIHCRAGMSRSRAFGEFIFRYAMEHGIDVEYEDRDEYLTLFNYAVLKRLNNAYWKKHKINGYENGRDYDDDLVNIPIIDFDPIDDK